MTPNEKVLIIGGRSSNFPPDLLNHHRLVFWLGHKGLKKPKFPERVGAVICTRFVSHKLYNRVRDMAEKAGAKFLEGLYGTGELRIELQKFLPGLEEVTLQPTQATPPTITAQAPLILTPEPEKEEKMEEVKQKVERGVLARFIEANADFSAKPSVETKRLYELAVERDINTTPSAVTSGFYLKKRKARLIPAKTTAKRGDSTKLLEEFISMSELAAVAFRELVEENKALSAEIAQLRQELGALGDVKKLLKKIKF